MVEGSEVPGSKVPGSGRIGSGFKVEGRGWEN
jgi:hypothetical protein